MIAIILACSDGVKEKAKALGFHEETVLVRHNAVTSNEENKKQIETEIREIHPYQFLVSDFWGMSSNE